VENKLQRPMEQQAELDSDLQRTHAPETSMSAGLSERRDRGLDAIGIFKLLQAVFFFAVGLGIVHLMHRDLGILVKRIATSLRFEPEGSFVNLLMSKLSVVDARRLMQLGAASFAYSAVTLAEGVGLLLHKLWAEYLTLILTALFLPWEMFELMREATPFRIGLLLLNLLVLVYLVLLLRKRGRL
jgi:uncharacterized membrane protein (DUF2068 family)